MTLRFVATSVLSSNDGIDFSNEVAIESEEAKIARLAAERASHRPLFEQLAEQRQKKQDEYDANTKLIFAPPKALDEEDVSFLRHLENQQQESKLQQKEEEARALEEFRVATMMKESIASSSSTISSKVKLMNIEKKPAITPVATVKIRAKRKVDAIENQSSSTESKVVKRVEEVLPSSSSNPMPASKPTSTVSSLLAAYGSDDEEDEENASNKDDNSVTSEKD
eukprot:gene1670-1819_t